MKMMVGFEFIVISQMMAETIDQMDFNYYGNLSPVKTALAVVKKRS
jgi:hypothetical protein